MFSAAGFLSLLKTGATSAESLPEPLGAPFSFFKEYLFKRKSCREQEKRRETDLSSTGSLPGGLRLGQARGKFQHVVLRAQVIGSSSVDFSSKWAGSRTEVEQLGLKSASTRDASIAGNSSTPNSRPLNFLRLI